MCDSKFGQRSINTIYFGGGTPSLADPSLFGSILDNIKSNFELADNCEVTLECNPTDADKLPEFKKIGINRVSLGIQSFDDEDLTFLGRKHTSSDAKKALETASQNFDKVSFDMIYARRAEQTVQKWQTELNNALKLCTGPVSHVSLYTLVMEQDTPLGRNVSSGQVKLPDEDSEADLYEITRDLAESFGLKQYEVSNFARGRENECQHSLKGWSGQDYWGIGPGACSRLTSGENGETKRYAYMCVKHPTRWMASCDQHGHGIDPNEDKELSHKERIQETLLMSLRTIYGINDEVFTKVTNGKKLKETLEWKEVERLERGGLLFYDNQRGHLYASRKGMALLDYIIQEITQRTWQEKETQQ